ncbi:MAG: hypothetical protein KH006_01130 [Firmicutes bacterium]|nr:hypothetical protein [Bacillota bacterium]
MRIYELETRPEPLLGRLVAVWERSVRATNDFLPDTERDEEGGEYPLLYMRK